MTELVYRTASELAGAIRAREVSATDVVETFLAQIAARNPTVNALVTVDESGATETARRADDALARGELWGPLHGVPVTFKDVFETAGLRTTCAHAPLADHVPKRDATVVARMRAAGAIVLGKTNLPELAMDVQSDNRLFGATNNPWNPERTAGGSAGGEAAALAAGMTPLGIGSDIGGSVRIPAHFCGVLGLKPTEGRVPSSGHIPPLPGTPNWVRHLAASGPMARSVSDLRLALQIIAGPDGRDPGVHPSPLVEEPPRPLESYRFAWTDDFGGLPVSLDTRDLLGRLADTLTNAGCHVEPTCPTDFVFEEVWQTYGELVGVMLAASLPLMPRALLKTLGPIMFRGDVITRAGCRRATSSIRAYVDVLERRDRLARKLEHFLAQYDGWLCPVASMPAFAHRRMGRINTPIDVDGKRLPGHLASIGYTSPFNLTGNPAVTLPLGLSQEDLPIGVQLVGRRWDDMALLGAAERLSEVIGPWRPPRPVPRHHPAQPQREATAAP